MKYLLLILAISTHMTFAQTRLTFGKTMAEVIKVYPELESTVNEKTTQLQRAETQHGLDGKWSYNFKDKKLDWMKWSKYNDQLNDSNFAACLWAARKLIEDYTLEFGKPAVFVTGDTTFVDPFKKHHLGYDVIQARWNDANGMKINIYFKFFGGKDLYTFIVAVNMFPKEYPYWRYR